MNDLMNGMNESVILIVGLCVLAVIFILGVITSLYRKAGPNEALIVYGFRGPRVVKGHGTVIFPMVESCRQLSLELMSFDVAPKQDLYTKQGVAVTVEAVAQIKVRSDQASILTAAEQFRRADTSGDGRPSARHYRSVDGGADRQGAGDGGRADARHLRRRHEQDGA
ncbi:MAG: SPFH domain-containing protein [Terracidiphilus sp.]